MRRKLLILALLITIFTAVPLFTNVKMAFATSGSCYFGSGTCSVSGNGAFATNDVFTGRSSSGGGSAIDAGDYNDKASFISYINSRYNGGDHNKTAAGFVISRMLGTSGRPGTTTVAKWNDLMNQNNVTLVTDTVNVTTTSWYVPSKNDTFFDQYEGGARSRKVIDIVQNGDIIVQIEVLCGNLTGVHEGTLEGWGNMQVESSVQAQASPGQPITWNHTVWDNGASGSVKTGTVSGDVYWSSATTGPIPAASRNGGGSLPVDVAPDKSYSTKFNVGKSNGVNRPFAFTIPSNAVPGQKYCQYITADKTSYNNGANIKSNPEACVTIIAPPACNLAPPSKPIRTSPVQFVLTGSTRAVPPPAVTVGFSLTNPSGTVINTQSIPLTYNASGSYTATITVNPPIGGFPGGIYTANATLSAGGVTSPVCPAHMTIGNYPYFSVVGGDIAAGPGFGNCSSTSAAGIIGSYNPANSNGSTAQLAALALGNIKAFATGKTQSGTTWVESLVGGSPSVSELAFANTPPNVGKFNLNTWCVPDYYGSANSPPAPGGTVDLGSLTSGVHTYSGNVYLSGNLAAGANITIKASGSIYITGDIKYASGVPIDKIPQLQVLAASNIYVFQNVGQIDGFYDAQGGSFVTCADAGGPLYGVSNYVACKKQLIVNGAVAAKTVVPNRTYGDPDTVGINSPAETFLFSPQLWLPGVAGGPPDGRWQSVTSLPPIL